METLVVKGSMISPMAHSNSIEIRIQSFIRIQRNSCTNLNIAVGEYHLCQGIQEWTK